MESDRYEEAYRFYVGHLEEFPNLLLKENGKVVQMEYGIVEFPSDKGCSINTGYHSTIREEDDYLNGCYAADAVYLYSSQDGNKVYFKLSGDTGYADWNEVILHPYESLNAKPSDYHYENGLLTHRIKTEIGSDFVAYAVQLQEELPLPSGDYFSYDGHYFYDDFYQMSDDYRDGTYEHAVNGEACYNYFQYLPYRSYSAYSEKDLYSYLHDDLNLDRRLDHYKDNNLDGANDEVNRSQLVGMEGDFIACQYLYGTNSMMLLSAAINESSYGKSLNSYIRNRLYLAAAYEKEEEAEAERYATVSDSIYSFSKYLLSARFADHLRKDYRGTFPGNKLGGINVNHSLDPYYGEKVAALYDQIDRKLGNRDRNRYALGIIIDQAKASFYADAEMKTLKYRLKDIHEAAFIILEETEESYKIRIDHSYSFEYRYDPERSVAYVPKDLFALVLNQDQIHEESFEMKQFDFNGGSWHGYDSLDIGTDGQDLSLTPKKTGYDFIAYDEKGTAQWKEIKEIALTGTFPEMSLYEPISLEGLALSIVYADQSEKEMPLNSDMISGYDPDREGAQDITICYSGLEMNAKVSVSSKKNTTEEQIREALKQGDFSLIKNHISDVSYPFTFNEIRKIDHKLHETSDRNYVINDYGVEQGLGISGLDLSLPDRDTFIYVNDTYYVDAQQIRSAEEEKIIASASAYGFEAVKGIDLSFRFNYEEIQLQGPVIVQLPVAEKKDRHIYTVYHLETDGDIVKCRTLQTKDSVVFMITEKGAYEVLAMPGINDYALPELTEELTKDNMGFDNHKINIGLLLTVSFALAGISGIIVFDIYNNLRKKLWKDFRKSLQTAGSVPEEEPKN